MRRNEHEERAEVDIERREQRSGLHRHETIVIPRETFSIQKILSNARVLKREGLVVREEERHRQSKDKPDSE
jgi:hypothetical protein